ncbi:Asp23/Gls24 family envelope stress response protein [Streptomyces sp. NPDC059680]|uniref:Asp23/Gls24 family envelope stress response protein n=1 Tax=Streptomyces sp. NPDC059680 TaxID=3346904 RepID=UPI0036784622
MKTQEPNPATTAGGDRGAVPDTTALAGGVRDTSWLPDERGRTTIADVVVVKIAGLAAREISGVYDMGVGISRTLGAVRERVPGGRPNVGRGVKVEVGERQAAVDLDLVIEYGVPIPEIARAVRENVISAVERITGLEVVEVNVNVDDVHLPEDVAPDTRVD